MTVGAEKGEIAEVGSPVIVPAAPALDARAPLRWTSTILAIATAVLSLGNAAAIESWLDELPSGRISERLRDPVDAWSRATAAAHLGAAHATLHRWWDEARSARFGGERPGEPGTR